MHSKFSYLLLSVATLTLVISQGLQILAQNATGSIRGTVTDQNGAVLAKANVAVINSATTAARKVTTSGDGTYSVENLLPGEYEVRVEAQGFVSQFQKLIVEVGNATTANFAMTVGAVSQTVEVTAEAPVINTTDTVVGGVINRERVENLPANGRSFLSAAAAEPGVNVSYTATSNAGNPNSFFRVSVGSAPDQMTLISVDGSRVNDRITGGTSQNFSAETVQEYQVSTLGFDLSSGTASAGIVNVVTRTGSNQFHGSAFFFFRDHNMAAFPGFKRPDDPTAFNPLCLNPAICARVQDPFFVRRQYGGYLSGPIKKNKLFFFGNYERTNQVGANAITFTDATLFGFNHIAQQPQKFQLGNVRLDYTVSPKHTAFLRASVDSNNGVSGPSNVLESTWIASSNFSYQTQLGVTSVFSAVLVNDFRFSYSYFRNRLGPPTQAECERASGNPSYCFNLNDVRITFYGGLIAGNSVNVPQDRHPRTYQWTDNVNWRKGAHRVRFGGNWEHSNAHGTWSLKSGGTGATVADLLKLPVNGTLSIGLGDPGQPARPYNYEKILANNAIRFYGQDAWQMFRGFTLNYGLGWSFEDNVLYHDIDLPDYLIPILGPNDVGKKITQRYKNFDPALGFAWAPFKDQKTVIRSSVSLHHISPNVGFYNLNQRILFGPAGNGLGSFTGSGLPNPKAGQPGQPALLNFTTPVNFTAQDLINNLALFRSQLAASNPFVGTDLFARGVNITKSVQGPQGLDAIYDNNSARFPYTIHVNIGVQREIVRNLAVSADFVMRRGVGSLGPMLYGLPGILSRYTAFQIKVDKRFSRGIQFGGSYVYSHYTSLVTISNNKNLYDGFGPVAANPHHRFSASGIYDLPKYKGELKLLRGVLNGWQVSTIMQMQTGPQTSVTLGSLDVDGDGTFVFRLPGTGVSSFGNGLDADDIRRLVAQYNASLPAAANVALKDIPKGPQRDAIGTSLPYIVLPDKFSSGDSFLTHDLRLTRTISIAEKVRLMLIGEGFNIFNIANLTGYSGTLNAYGRPSTTGGSPTLPASGLLFGQPTNRVNPVFGSGGPRAFQFAARVSF